MAVERALTAPGEKEVFNALAVALEGNWRIDNPALIMQDHTLRQKNNPTEKNITPKNTIVNASSDPFLMLSTNSFNPFLIPSTIEDPDNSTETGASIFGESTLMLTSSAMIISSFSNRDRLAFCQKQMRSLLHKPMLLSRIVVIVERFSSLDWIANEPIEDCSSRHRSPDYTLSGGLIDCISIVLHLD